MLILGVCLCACQTERESITLFYTDINTLFSQRYSGLYLFIHDTFWLPLNQFHKWHSLSKTKFCHGKYILQSNINEELTSSTNFRWLLKQMPYAVPKVTLSPCVRKMIQVITKKVFVLLQLVCLQRLRFWIDDPMILILSQTNWLRVIRDGLNKAFPHIFQSGDTEWGSGTEKTSWIE